MEKPTFWCDSMTATSSAACDGELRGGTLAVVSIVLVSLLAGCASTPEPCRAPIGEPALTPRVAAEAERGLGESITWGGTLVAARNRVDATDLEVLAYPLGNCGRPLLDEPAQGRFIVRRPGYLETAELRPGSSITASGRIIAISDGRIGDAAYRLPVLEDAAPTLWPAQETASWGSGRTRPWVSVGVGGGRGWSGGGIGVWF
jgi:outer membrane lipoprotein